MIVAPLLLCAAAHVVDGDTIKCSAVGRVRMVAIDAPDKLSSVPCRTHIGDHVCDDIKAAAATKLLTDYAAGKRITYRVVGYDARWRRSVAQMFAGRHDLQCYMLAPHLIGYDFGSGGSISGSFQLARYLPVYDARYHYPILHRCPRTVKRAWR